MNSLQSILTDVKDKKFSPVYFLMGDEPYFIDIIEKALTENVLTEEEKAFNQTLFYGKDSNIPDIVDACKRYPMMAERQLIVVREAQELSRAVEKLVDYVAQPQPSTVLVVCYKYKSLDKRKKLYKPR